MDSRTNFRIQKSCSKASIYGKPAWLFLLGNVLVLTIMIYLLLLTLLWIIWDSGIGVNIHSKMFSMVFIRVMKEVVTVEKITFYLLCSLYFILNYLELYIYRWKHVFIYHYSIHLILIYFLTDKHDKAKCASINSINWKLYGRTW